MRTAGSKINSNCKLSLVVSIQGLEPHTEVQTTYSANQDEECMHKCVLQLEPPPR